MNSSDNARVLLQAGADYSKPNELTGRNVIHTCVANNQCQLLQELLTSQNSQKLTGLTDNRGDTPLMLAIRIACADCVQTLTKFSQLSKEFNEITSETLLHMAVQTNRNDILSIIAMLSPEHLMNHRDSEGRTPLLLAIENEKNHCMKKLMYAEYVYKKNDITDETALHTAIRVNNEAALNMLMNKNNHLGAWCFSQQSRDGKTPLWEAIEQNNSLFIAEARKGRWVDVDQLNQHGDSCTYVAAAFGHIEVLKSLLLSDKFYSFSRTYGKKLDFTGMKNVVKDAEISSDIYSSDIYILTGEIRQNKSHSRFPKTFFNTNEKEDRNIFHACALGGNVHCLDFIYTFVKIFSPNNLYLFDVKDIYGNTPLQLATRHDLGGPECVYYFLSNRADLASCNKSGEYVLESILKNTEHSTDLLLCILNEGIVYDQEAKGLQQGSDCLQVHFSILKPATHMIKVIKLFFDKIHGEQRFKLLDHALFKMYVHLVLRRVNYFFAIRFFLRFLFALLLTVYLLFFRKESDKSFMVQSSRYSLGFLCVIGLLFSFPLLLCNGFTMTGFLTLILMAVPYICCLIMIAVPHGSDFFFDIAAITMLTCFFSVIMYSTMVFKNLSDQMAMLSQVIYEMLKYSGVVIFVLWAFSLVLFCTFNDTFYSATPIRSLVANVLLLGSTISKDNFSKHKHVVLNETNSGAFSSDMYPILTRLNMCFEYFIIFLFVIMVRMALITMLESLAIREGTLEASGSILQRHLQIHWLSNLEKFLDSFTYKVLKHTPFIYLVGIVPLRTNLDVNVVYLPMADKRTFTQKSVLAELKRITMGGREFRKRHSIKIEQLLKFGQARRKEDPIS